MSNTVRTAVETYVRASGERDPALRTALLEACYAADGRFVTLGRELRGRDALAREMARFWEDPRASGIRLTSAIDAGATTFRLSAVVDFSDGSTSPEQFEAGEVDADGRISLILTFTGPLPAPSSAV